MSRGFVHLVGAGPGDPDLLTVRAAALIGRADAIVYDRLVHPGVLRLARRGTRLIFVGKEAGKPQIRQEEIGALLIQQARLDRQVVRLKGGDPFVFGRGGEEALALRQAGIGFAVVPGVSSGIAAPAAAGIPVTHRGLAGSVTFATGTLRKGRPNWPHLAAADTLVLFMACRQLSDSTASLIAAGRAGATPAALIESGTWDHQRVLVATLATIAARAVQARLGSPALLVVGEVVRLRAELGEWASATVAPARDAGARRR